MASYRNSPPLWKSEAFIVLTLLLFAPVGLFLMWKYAPWKKGTKILLTLFFGIGMIPLFIFGLLAAYLFIFNSAKTIDNLKNPEVVNNSNVYVCQPINTEWGSCVSEQYHASFEYPVSWYYTDVNLLSNKYTIGFSPVRENIRDTYVISFAANEIETEERAKSFVDGIRGIDDATSITIDNLPAVRVDDESTSTVTILNGRYAPQFWLNLYKHNFDETKLPISKDEAKAIYDHMIESFRVEQ